MAIYVFECRKCESEFDVMLKVADRNTPQNCPHCGAEDTKRIIKDVDFILKGDGWPGKAIRVKGQMAARRKKVGAKEEEQKKDAPLATLVPNVDGEEVDTWTEAKSLAASKDKDASSYDTMVEKEKSGDL